MKKQLLNIAIFSIMLLGLSYQVKSQNCIGLSKTEIQSRFKEKGIELTTTIDDDGTCFVWFFNEIKDYQTYYLNSSNICYQYAIVFNEANFDKLAEVLTNQGYKNYDDSHWRNDKFKIKINYLADLKKWFMVTTYK